jgi:DNA-binding beta-propeller fold protein YncE
MVKWLPLFAVAIVASCGAPQRPAADAPAAPPRLELVWRLGGLANPESVQLSRDGTFLYVSNVNGEGDAHDGNGFISGVSTDGTMLQRDWATGLDAPKGLVLAGDTLVVTDIDRIVLISTETGQVTERITVAGAQFLNDAAIMPDGTIIAADSGGQRIYAVRNGAAEVWLEHDLLNSINGFLPEPSRLIVTTMAGRLLAIDYESRVITVLAEGLGNADGIAWNGGGRYLVSEWPGQMYVVNPDGTYATILDTRAENRFMNDFLLVGDTLYQPHWEPSELSAYRLVQTAP